LAQLALPPHIDALLPVRMWRLLLPLFAASSVVDASRWYDGLESVKVFSPGDTNVQQVIDEVWKKQRRGQFNENRFALIFTRGDYKDVRVPAGYYTHIMGAVEDPGEVKLADVVSINGDIGGATQNFWRAVEGVTLTGPAVVWAVSQGAPMRRSVVQGDLYLSDNGGWSSGGFMAGVRVGGVLDMGTQQQWFFRNIDLGPKGVKCPIGWNYVFVGVQGLDRQRCQGSTPGKVVEVPGVPRIAEKPYLVQEKDGETWNIYVPAVARSSSGRPIRGAAPTASSAIARKLDLASDVFVAKPGMSSFQIAQGMQGKAGLLLTPGIYDLEAPIDVGTDAFVVLGLGFPTLVAHGGRSALTVKSGLVDVRIAGLLLEAGTPGADGGAPPLLVFGDRPAVALLLPAASGLPPRRRLLQRQRRRLDDGGGSKMLSGVVSDLFARVGSFKYQGCTNVSVESMMEINSDDVVVDNAWLWHADHDDCSDPELGAVQSDSCYSAHGLVVNGDRVTVYGLSAEHAVGGDIVRWSGEDGETYFYQCELPYNHPEFGVSGYSGYKVDRAVARHTAKGLGVYIIGGMKVKAAYSGSPTLDLENLVTVVIGQGNNGVKQFENSACMRGAAGLGEQCIKPNHCDQIRCVLTSMDRGKLNSVGSDSTGGVVPESTVVPKVEVVPDLLRLELRVTTSSQLLADCQTGASFRLLVDGTWTKARPLFSVAGRSEVLKATVRVPAWPTKLRLDANGIDSWGFKRIVVSGTGRSRTLLDSPDGELYGGNRFWLDGSGGAAPGRQEFEVPEEDTQWSIFNHFDVRETGDLEQMDGFNLDAVKQRVEQGGYAGFSLSLGQAWLKPLGDQHFTRADLVDVGDVNPAAFFLYEAQFTTTATTSSSTAAATTAAPTTPAPIRIATIAAPTTAPTTTMTLPMTPAPAATTWEPTATLWRMSTTGAASVALAGGSQEPGSMRLRVTVIRAAGLKTTDWIGGTDPYCVIVLSDREAKEKTQFQTKMMHNTRNPEWNHAIEIPAYAQGDSLEFVIMDKDFWVSNILGTAALTGDQLYPGGFEGELPIAASTADAAQGGGGGTAGQATLSVKVEILPNVDVALTAVVQKEALEGRRALAQGLQRLLSQLGSGSLLAPTAAASLLVLSATAAATLWRSRRGRARLQRSRENSWEPLVFVE